MGKKLLVLSSSLLLLLFVVTPVFASRGEVLADSTRAAELNFPPVTQGSGFILPNSPLFFLDQWFQNFKIALASTPEDKAKVRSQIIGERMAELKVMLAQNNQKGIDNALQNLTDESNSAAKDILSEANKGKNVEEAAKILNESIKNERDVLSLLAKQSTGSLEHDFESAKEKAKVHKSAVEDKLPLELLENEIEIELENEINDKAEEAGDALQIVEDNLKELQSQASEAARENQTRRLEIIKKAIEDKNEALKKENEKLLEADKKEREIQKKEQELLRESAKKAAEAANELQKQTETHDQENSDSGSDSSGSGNSGSGSSGSSGGGSDSGEDNN